MAKKNNSLESDSLSPFAKAVLESVGGPQKTREKAGRITVQMTDPFGEDIKKQESESMKGASPLVKSVMNLLNGPGDTIERLAFEQDPSQNNTYQSLYKTKLRLLPDEVLKRIAIQDDLVAAICNARANQMSAFGRPQPDRFSTGYKIEPQPGYMDTLNEEERKALQARIAKAELKLLSCGDTKGWKDQDVLTFGQFLYMSTRNACIFGRIAVEAIYVEGLDGRRRPHSFRPIDAGTIFRAAPIKGAADSVRRQALLLLEQVKNKNLEPERYKNDEYAWVQVIAGRPVQAFTAEECLVHSFYPTTDVELDGYPLTPLDTIIAAVTTHINITNHNKLYFQSGRAARGMIVIKSDDADDGIIKHIRQQFQASINSVGNSWRMPIFGVGTDDDIGWYPIDNSSRDMEFQYLSDTNARVILSAFQMSPEELPGYAHLSRGTNNQALSECFDGNSYLWTSSGLKTANELLLDKDEKALKLWNGTSWQSARLFRTGKKLLAETHAGGLSLKTSPDHRFRVLSEDGELVWKRQEDLAVGDLLTINKTPVPGDIEAVPSFQGRRLTLEVCEALGWLSGDGSLVGPASRAGGYVKLFYNHSKERDLWVRHAKALSAFGLDVKHHERLVSPEEADNIRSRYGFESVASSRITNTVYNTDFVRWLHDLGFGYSKEGKTIPPVFHILPVEYRQSFLRGLFSADGHATKNGQVVLTVQNDKLREQTKQMLLGLGVRTLGCQGLLRAPGFGRNPEKTFSHKLFVKDREVFWRQIGFLQSHKMERRKAQKWAQGTVPARLAARLLVPVLQSDAYRGWSKGVRDSLRTIAGSAGLTPQSISWGRLEAVLVESLGSVPSWMSDFYFEPVTDLVEHKVKADMVDVEVFDGLHAQILQGFQVHNSNNEYKLQAHRDVGIRPMMAHFQNFINSHILPIIDEELAKTCSLKFVGLDAETAEKESVRLQSDMAVHMTMDEVLEKVEKKPVGKEWGGKFLLNPQWQAVLDKYVPQGMIMEHFFGMKGASKDPRYDFLNNPNYFTQTQLLQAQQQMQMAAQQPQQPPQGGQGGEGEGEVEQQAEGQQDAGSQPQQGGDDARTPDDSPEDLTRSLDQLTTLMSKSEVQLPQGKRRLLVQQRKFVQKALESFEHEAGQAMKEIMDIAEVHAPKGKKGK